MAVFIGMTALGGATVATGAAATAGALLGTGVTIGWSTAFFAASVLYQQAMARRAKRAADARKGQFISFEGSISTLPIVYGRARVAGVKVYQTTHNDFNHQAETDTEIDTFMAGGKESSEPYDVEVEPETQDAFEKVAGSGIWFKTMPAKEGTTLDKDRKFSNHEMLYVEQAICVGPISKCWDIIIDDNYTYNRQEYSHGLKVIVHRTGGNNSQMIAANSPSGDLRVNAKFRDVAHAGMAFRYNRDDPQYSGTPNVNFLIEGRKVKTVDYSGNLSPSRTYTSNPAFCLLDYLMDSDYGLGLNANEIDLLSFHSASVVCNRVAASAAVSGRIWKPTNKSRNVSSNSYRQFECNVTLDTAADIRDNVNTLLGTMHGARLVWSAGRYRLAFTYPQLGTTETTNTADMNNANKLFVSLVTDDEIIRNTIEIIPPSLDEKLNYCTVRFFNENKDFKEDTASWPPRFGSAHQDFLNKDGGRNLETDVTAEGVTAPVLAVAFAEETVRASRIATKVTFSCIVRDRYYEPGDVIKLQSKALDLGYTEPFYIRVDEVTVDDTGTANVKGVRFDARTLAYNAADNIADPLDPASTAVQPPADFAFTAGTAQALRNMISGRLTWTASVTSAVTGYELYYGLASDVANTTPKWNILGRDTASPFEIPEISNGRYMFGIKAFTADNRFSEMVITASSTLVSEEPLPAPISVIASTTFAPKPDGTPVQGELYRAIRLQWAQPTLTADQKQRYAHTEVWHNLTGTTPTVNVAGDVSGAVQLFASAALTVTHDNLTSNALHYYWTRNVTKRGTKSVFSSPAASATPKLSISQFLAGLSDYVDELALTQLLRNKIDWTSAADYTTARDWVLDKVKTVNDKVDSTKLDVWNTLAQITNGVTETVTKDGTTIQTLYALKQSTGTSTAAILQLNDVSATSTSSNVRALRALASRVGSASGMIIDLDTINTDPNSTLVSRLYALDAVVRDPVTGLAAATGRISQLDSVSVKKDGVEVGRITNLEGAINNPTTGLAQAHGRIANIDNILLTPTTGIVHKVSLLETGVNTTIPNLLNTKVTAGQVNDQIASASPNQATTTAINVAKSEAAGAVGLLHYGPNAPTGTALRPLKTGDVWHKPNANGGVEQYIYSGGAWLLKNDYIAVNAMAAISDVEQTKIGYCLIGGKASDHTSRGTCEAAGGVWQVGLPLATAVKQVQITYNGSSAGIEQAFKVAADVAVAADGKANAVGAKLNATYTLRINNGNKVTGFGLSNDGARSDMVFQVDNFFIAGSEYGTGQTPFAVLTSPMTRNGITYPAGVYAQNAFIDNLQINRGQIQGGSIGATYFAAGVDSASLSVNLPEGANIVVWYVSTRIATKADKGMLGYYPLHHAIYGNIGAYYGSSINTTVTAHTYPGGNVNYEGAIAIMATVLYR